MYEVRRIVKSDYDNVLEFLKNYYLPDNPVLQNFGLSEELDPVFIDIIIKELDQGLSLLIELTENSKILAICINKFTDTEEHMTELKKLYDDLKPGNLKNYIEFFYYYKKDFFLQKLGKTNIFEVSRVGVHPDYRENKLTVPIVYEALMIAKKLDCELMYTDVVSK